MSEKEENKQIKCPQIEPKGTIRDFILPIVEFLGILVPGVIFIFAFFPTVIMPIQSILSFFNEQKSETSIFTESLLQLIFSPSFGSLTLLFIFAYVTGHLFFRQDPKIPDQYSFKKVINTIGETGPVRLCVEERKYNMENGINNEHNLEFPYRYLYEYLSDRGMHHLAAMIPWRGRDPNTYPLRTKHFINTIKVRLEFLFPYQYLRILRNEAHVRLMSSMWYASRSLLYLSALGGIFGLIALIKGISSGEIGVYITSFVFPLGIFCLALAVKNHIESFLHYQRIREIVFILESAFFAQSLYPDVKIFEKVNQDKAYSK